MSRLPSPASVMAALKRAGLNPYLRVDTRTGIWEVLCADEAEKTSRSNQPDVADLIDGIS